MAANGLEKSIEIKLPAWSLKFFQELTTTHFPGDTEKMDLVLKLLALQVQNGGGGPFSAVVFDQNHNVLSLGVNQVTAQLNSTLHAEMVALQFAQLTLQTNDLRTSGHCTLVSSAQPCAQCAGALPWSGIARLVYGASASDTESLGFDEGPIHPEWIKELEKRGICVAEPLASAKALEIMRRYSGPVYNGSSRPS